MCASPTHTELSVSSQNSVELRDSLTHFELEDSAQQDIEQVKLTAEAIDQVKRTDMLEQRLGNADLEIPEKVDESYKEKIKLFIEMEKLRLVCHAVGQGQEEKDVSTFLNEENLPDFDPDNLVSRLKERKEQIESERETQGTEAATVAAESESAEVGSESVEAPEVIEIAKPVLNAEPEEGKGEAPRRSVKELAGMFSAEDK